MARSPEASYKFGTFILIFVWAIRMTSCFVDRYGFASAARSAAFGGLLLGLIEGVSIMLNRMTAPMPEQSLPMDAAGGLGPAPAAPSAPVETPSSPPESDSGGGGAWGGMFGSKSR